MLYKRPFIRDFKTFWLKTAISCNLVCFIAVISHSKFLKLIETWIRQQKTLWAYKLSSCIRCAFFYILFLRMPWWLGCNKFTQNNILCWTLEGNLLQTSSFCQMLQVTQQFFPCFCFQSFFYFLLWNIWGIDNRRPWSFSFPFIASYY